MKLDDKAPLAAIQAQILAEYVGHHGEIDIVHLLLAQADLAVNHIGECIVHFDSAIVVHQETDDGLDHGLVHDLFVEVSKALVAADAVTGDVDSQRVLRNQQNG